MRGYLPRLLTQALSEALRGFPAVLVTGPRQSGKTTLLREEFGEGAGYVTFDDPLERDFARTDPEGFLDRFGERRAILDEVQYVPELFQYLKIRIDRDRQAQRSPRRAAGALQKAGRRRGGPPGRSGLPHGRPTPAPPRAPGPPVARVPGVAARAAQERLVV